MTRRTADWRRALAACRIDDGARFRLADHAPDATHGLDDHRDDAAALLRAGTERLAALQEQLYAQDRWSVLVLIQALDAAGKDGAIKHVFSGLNPQGCQVEAFKAPTATELDHDFLWRHVLALPRRGHLGIHNRSWYEEVLVARVRPEVFARQQLPDPLRTPAVWQDRLADIAAFEGYLARQGTVVLKVFLHVSAEEQRRRFLERIAEPEKHWKFNAGDVADRRFRDDYLRAYEAAIAATAAPHAPWFVIPADRKWLARLLVSEAIVTALEGIGVAWPTIGPEARAALDAARRELGG